MIDLTIRGLVKSFEVGSNVLDGVTFEVNTGERVGILGRNGCGKTTLFRILSGELTADAGEVSVAAGARRAGRPPSSSPGDRPGSAR